MKNTALLVIDMQNDFVKQGSHLEVKGIRNNMIQFKNFITESENQNEINT